jgi:agmatine/peptidylarginine deiminase
LAQRIRQTIHAENAEEQCEEKDQVYCDIIRAIGSSAAIIVLVEDAQSRDRAARVLSERQVASDGVRFVQASFQSEWVRDYGPMGLRASEKSHLLIDAEYVIGPVGVYPYEGRFPSLLGVYSA